MMVEEKWRRKYDGLELTTEDITFLQFRKERRSRRFFMNIVLWMPALVVILALLQKAIL